VDTTYPPGSINVYTDGSGIGSRTGAGVVIYGNNLDTTLGHFAEPMPSSTSVFQSEVQAINLATRTLVLWRCRNETIVINSDSTAAIQALTSTLVQSTLVQNTVYLLNNLGRQNRVVIQWIKAHVGHPGNEMADKLAKEGASQLQPSRFPTGVSMALLKLQSTKAMTDQWNRSWRTPRPCRQTKLWFPYVSPRKSKMLLSKGRVTLGLLVQFMTGFNHLGYHVHNMGKCEDDTCRLCLESTEDSWHLASDCPATWHIRQDLWGIRGPDMHSWTTSQVCRLVDHPSIKEILTQRPI
jgi:ribonuclease HI